MIFIDFEVNFLQDETIKTKPPANAGGFSWRWTDLNRRHTDFQSDALPTELHLLVAKLIGVQI